MKMKDVFYRRLLIFFSIFEKFKMVKMDVIHLKNIVLDGVTTDIYIKDGLFWKIIRTGQADSVTVVSIPEGLSVETVDCTGMAAVPGFVNMHTHAAMSLMRGLGEDMLFPEWLERIWAVEKNVDADFVYMATKVACLEMIKSGTTSFNDHYWFPSAGHRAAVEMGLRPLTGFVAIDRNDSTEAGHQKEECLRLYEESENWGDGTGMAIGFHAIYSVSEELILWCAEFARSKGLRLHIHLAETEWEVAESKSRHGVSPVVYLDRLGVLGPNVIAAHTLWLSDEDVEILGRNSVSCVHNINSNLKLASGYRFRYRELRDAGANVCLGTDGCASSNNLDMLEAIKTSAMVQKAWREDPTAMPLRELIDMATVNGGKAMGTGAGRIAEGAVADMMIVDTDNVHFLSPGSFLANFIYSAHSDCIDSVICRGRFLMRGRKVNGEKEILHDARRLLKRFA